MGKVLLVDDNRDFLEALKATMEASGFNVELANSGFEALTLIRSDSMQIDCVLTDYQMPEMTGDELATAIKHKSSIPVIIMTGNIDIPVDKLFKSGISGVIHKPFDSRHFIDFLKNNDLHIGQDLNKSRKLLRQTSLNISQKIQISNGRRSIEGDIFNISSGGIGISLVESFQPMSTVKFNFTIEGHEVSGFMHSRWTAKEGDQFLAGFEFDSTTKKALSLNELFGKWITISQKAK